jgi:hypothetical protein
MRIITIDEKLAKEIEKSGNMPCTPYLLSKGIVTRDRFERSSDDKYDGNIFGDDLDLEDYHMFYRKFHKNTMRAFSTIFLKEYCLLKKKGTLLDEIKDVVKSNRYNLRNIACHNFIVLLISAMEVYFKDNFKIILTEHYPDKIKKSVYKTMKMFNFQNVQSIERAFSWLIPDFVNEINNIYMGPKEYNEELMEIGKNMPDSVFDSEREKEIQANIQSYQGMKTALNEILQFRHKIVHESYYDPKFSSKKAFKMFEYIRCYINNFDSFFYSRNFYPKTYENVTP